MVTEWVTPVFEYNDEFLMKNSTSAVGREEMYYLCCADSSAEDQLAELARLVGGGGSAVKEKTETIILLEDAPKLEFDLEQELSKAFASVPYSSAENPSIGPEATPHIAPPAVVEATVTAQPEPIKAANIEPQSKTANSSPGEPAASVVTEEIAQSDIDLDDLISKEFELALQEESKDQASEKDAELEEAVDIASDTFDAELARLMGGDQDSSTATKMPPPVPGLTVTPPDAPVIVETPSVPTVSEPEVLVNSINDSLPPQMSDVESPNIHSSVQESVMHGEFELAHEHLSLTTEYPDTPALDSGEGPEFNVEEQPAIDPAAATPIVQSEIKLDVLEGSNPAFHDDQISIPEPHAAIAATQNRKTAKRTAGSLVAVALVAGIGLAGWNAMGGSDQVVPTILASSEPVKIKPKDAGGTVVPNQDQAVYRSVESSKKVEPKQESLTDNSEKPIVVATKVGTGAGKSETRIKRSELSSGEGVVLKPRRVRTVVVKPDGTILTQSSDVKTDDPKLALKTPTAKPKLVVPKLKTPVPAPKKVAVKQVAPVKQPAQVKTPTPTKNVAVVKKPEPVKKVAAVKKPAPVKKQAPVKKAASVKKPVPAKKPSPIKKKPESVTSTASVSSPYAVQVASQRSPEAAERTYKVLARRYASVFRGKSMDIRKADIKGKGIYYRARIPAQTKASARKICRQLKAKGGDCFVTR